MKRKDFPLSDRVRGWLLNKLAGKWTVVINADVLPKGQFETVVKASNGDHIYIRNTAFGKDIMIRANNGVSGDSEEYQRHRKDLNVLRTYDILSITTSLPDFP